MIDIVLAVYKPNEFIIEQVSSICNQTFYERISKIIISMDESSEQTLNLVNRCLLLTDKILVVNNLSTHGPSGNFFNGFRYADSPYIMTCDQDDFWLNNKIELCMQKIESMEENTHIDTPLLVGTDLKIVDENLYIIEESFFKAKKISHSDFYLESLCFKNVVPGCTMLFNKALLLLIGEYNSRIVMHDWWILLIAALCGRYSILNTQTILYRQHSNNCIGAGLHKKISFIKRVVNKIKYIKSVNLQILALSEHLVGNNIRLDMKREKLFLDIVDKIRTSSIRHYVTYGKNYFN